MIDFRKQIEDDIARYERMLTQFKSGRASIGDQNSQGRLTNTTLEMITYLERIVEQLRGLLSNWPS